MAEQCDPRFDFFSELFDPLAALRNVSLSPPDAVAPLDNLAKYNFLYPTPFSTAASTLRAKAQEKESVAKETDQAKGRKNERQAPGKPKERFVERSGKLTPTQLFPYILAKYSDGPLSLLGDFYKEKARVRVLVRRHNGIRGTYEGRLVMFDKHWNMLLQHVKDSHTLWIPPERVEGEGVGTGRWEKRERTVKQLLVMGTSVVSVTRAS